MKLLVIGAHHGLGACCVELARKAGHDVASFEGDVLMAGSVGGQMSGWDAVISTLGPRRGSPDDLCSRGTANIVAAMRAHGVRRLVLVSGAIVGHRRDRLGLVYRMIAAMVAKAMLVDRQEAERAVMTSGLDWTIVRPVRLTDGSARGSWHENPNRPIGAFAAIARADAAAAVLRAVADPACAGREITLQY